MQVVKLCTGRGSRPPRHDGVREAPESPIRGPGPLPTSFTPRSTYRCIVLQLLIAKDHLVHPADGPILMMAQKVPSSNHAIWRRGLPNDCKNNWSLLAFSPNLRSFPSAQGISPLEKFEKSKLFTRLAFAFIL